MDCGECTLCCKLLEIKAKNSPPLEYCPSCDLCKGCKDYKDRPTECRNFQCSWLLDDKAHESLRPDKCGIMFENVNESIVLGLVEPGREVDSYMMAQIKAFQRSGSSVVLHTFEGKKVIFCTEGAKAKEVWQVIEMKCKDYGGS